MKARRWQNTQAGVLFDLDETLIDRSASIVRYIRQLWAACSADISIAEERFVDALVKIDGNGYVDRPTFFRAVADVMSNALSAEQVESHYLDNAWNEPLLMSGALAGLQSLRGQGVKVGIVTNGGSRNQRAKLRNTGLDAMADCVVISGEFGAKKPDSSIFLAAAHELGIEPANSWFLGDYPERDIAGADQLGFRTTWLIRAVPWPDDLEPCYTAKASSLAEAFNVIETAS